MRKKEFGVGKAPQLLKLRIESRTPAPLPHRPRCNSRPRSRSTTSDLSDSKSELHRQGINLLPENPYADNTPASTDSAWVGVMK